MTPIQILACILIGALLTVALVSTSVYIMMRILRHLDMVDRAIARTNDYTKEN